jgi:hypothetical protein
MNKIILLESLIVVCLICGIVAYGNREEFDNFGKYKNHDLKLNKYLELIFFQIYRK